MSHELCWGSKLLQSKGSSRSSLICWKQVEEGHRYNEDEKRVIYLPIAQPQWLTRSNSVAHSAPLILQGRKKGSHWDCRVSAVIFPVPCHRLQAPNSLDRLPLPTRRASTQTHSRSSGSSSWRSQGAKPLGVGRRSVPSRRSRS